jgi:hypothetical protein
MRKIVIAYHAFMVGSGYMDMMVEQFRLILSSKLYPAVDKIYIGVVDHPDKYPKNGKEWIESFWKFGSSKKEGSLEKTEIVFYLNNNEEADTLKWVRDYAKDNPDDYILYFHTKSVSHANMATEDWRRYMEYFNIENWTDCVQKLDEGYDCCGVMWNVDTPIGMYPHFSGNFWWAKASYINTLKHEWLDTEWRYHREFWIGSNPNVKAYEFHNSKLNDKQSLIEGKGHFDVTYPRNRYEKNRTMKIHVIVTVFRRMLPLTRLIYDFLGQSNPNWTMSIVHDGQASEDLPKMIESFNDLRLSFRETPQVNGKWGFPNRKMMVQEIEGNPDDFLLITNDDNEYIQPFVDMFLAQCQPDVGMVYCNTIHSYMGYEILQTRMQVMYIDMGSFITRLDVAKAVGFNHEHEQADGVFAEECAAECGRRGLRVVQINKALFCHN